MASREFAELEVIAAIAAVKDVAVGIVDVKSYWIEPAGGGGRARAPLPAPRPGRAPQLRPRLRPQPDGPLGGASQAAEPGRRRRHRAPGARPSVIEPRLADDALLADIREADRERPTASGSGGSGRAAFSCSTQGRHLLLDPYLSESLTKKYAATDKPHVRMTRRAVDPARLDFIDVVTPRATTTPITWTARRSGPCGARTPGWTLVIPEANRAFVAERLGCPLDWPLGLDDGQETEPGRIPHHGGAGRPRGDRARRERSLPSPGLRRPLRGASASTTPATACPTRARPSACGPSPSTSPCCRSTAALRSAACPATSPASRPRSSPTRSARGSRSPATTTCSSSTRPRPPRSLAEAERLRQPCRVLACGERFSSTDLRRTA